MKNIVSKLVLVAFLCSTLSGTAFAREFIGHKANARKAAAMQTKAAACKRAQSTAELNINNVRALINGYGNMWYDGSVAQYHLPKSSNTCPLFCAALWIGGTDVNDQLRIAALRFGSEGDDYWPGPLELTSATVDLPVCNKYDKHFVISKTEVQTLMSMFDYPSVSDESGKPVPNANFNPSLVSQTIKDWPAHGSGNQSPYLAPFYDADHDGQYDWQKGDYPYYDFDNELCPRTLKATWGSEYTKHVQTTLETQAGVVTGGLLSDQVLKGDQTIWWVFNDMGNVHTETQGQPIGMEIRAQAFAFATNDEINDMTFYSYEIINRSTYELRDTYFSQWVDADLGYAFDDYVGCDVRRGLGYCYNGDGSDGPGSGSYSGIPPAVGIDFFQGPYMDPDGIDNPKIDINKMRLYYPNALAKYWVSDEYGYDTISLTDDADEYLQAWYFKKDDAIGNCAINGVNFGNNIIDDERFGMRRFVYYNNNSNAVSGEPEKATDYYNYLRGYWKNGQRMTYGGDGQTAGGIPCDFMFPGDSDPWNWGTNGVDPQTDHIWTEPNEQNPVGDRRFMQSAGPFTLKPGALNYITVGIPFAQATTGDQNTSVEELREIDDVCQALFENCFKVLDGPEAPTLVAQELNNEVILYIKYDNPEAKGESYVELDPTIKKSDGSGHDYTIEQRCYKFEGYQIFQLANEYCTVKDITNPEKAHLVAQCDLMNFSDDYVLDTVIRVVDNKYVVDTVWKLNSNPSQPLAKLVNYTRNTATGLLSPEIMVDGANAGLKHVFRITTDAFASGTNTSLVNNKKYYFICVAYAENHFKTYSQTEADKLDGQKEPYLAGRKNEYGGAITPITVIPHDPSSENGGTVVQAEFGMCPNITRIEGYGNGGSVLRLTDASIEELMGAPGQPGKPAGKMKENWKDMEDNPCMLVNPKYEQNAGPISVKVIDPLNVKVGKFIIKFDQEEDIPNAYWTIFRSPDDPQYGTFPFVYDTLMSVESDFAINRYNEQLFLNLGIMVSMQNPEPIAESLSMLTNDRNGSYWGGFVREGALINSSMTFANNNTPWLEGFPDNDDYMMYNWIRSGSQFNVGTHKKLIGSTAAFDINDLALDEDIFKTSTDSRTNLPVGTAVDEYQVFEDCVDGMWAPYGLTSTQPFHPGFCYRYYVASQEYFDSLVASGMKKMNRNKVLRSCADNNYIKAIQMNDLAALPSVRIVFTNDTSKWTRCPILEMCDDYTQSEGNARRFQIRRHKSVDKLGRTVDQSRVSSNVNDPGNPSYIAEEGMGWFPGYAINTVTGERLNMLFGEDSRYIQYHGRDMMWNPVSTIMDGTQNYVMGGGHFIYVMNATNQFFYDFSQTDRSTTYYKTPSYDAGAWSVKMLRSLDHLMNFVGQKDALHYGVVASEYDNSFIAQRDSAMLFFSSCAWVNMPLVNARYEFENPINIPCDAVVDIDVATPYARYLSANKVKADAFTGNKALNKNFPMYQFELTSDIATLTGQATKNDARQTYKDSILSRINVVPNPYYSYSTYETASQLETKVRIVNLPIGSTVSIYTVDGTLVRRLGPTSGDGVDIHGHANTAGNASTLDWDLHNHNGIPIAGGVYLIHVKSPGIGERVIKWFGTMRPVDLNSFGF